MSDPEGESKIEIEITDSPTGTDQAALGEWLNVFNDEIVGYSDRRIVAVFARDAVSGTLLGGMVGRTSLGLLFIDTVYLTQALRGRGIGGQMLAAAESEARARGCVSGVLYTISFQAPGFYEQHGWRRFGEIACLPPGTSRVFMTKKL